MLNVKIKNEAKIVKAWLTAPEQMGKALKQALAKTGVKVVGDVKMVITSGEGMWKPPIDTGRMRQGIYVSDKKDWSVTISPSSQTPYALNVHEGTKKMRKRPFFEITEKKVGKEIGEFFNKALNEFIKQQFK